MCEKKRKDDIRYAISLGRKGESGRDVPEDEVTHDTLSQKTFDSVESTISSQRK